MWVHYYYNNIIIIGYREYIKREGECPTLYALHSVTAVV